MSSSSSSLHLATPSSSSSSPLSLSTSKQNENNEEVTDKQLAYLRSELLKYLNKRQQIQSLPEGSNHNFNQAPSAARSNVLLDLFSVSPKGSNQDNKLTSSTPPNELDYDELIKYGYGHLVTPIMNAGGRFAMYPLVDLPEPQPPDTATTRIDRSNDVENTMIVIDRTGVTDSARYQGLKLTQVLDDAAQAEALRKAQEKTQVGIPLRAMLEEERYERPFTKSPPLPSSSPMSVTAEQVDEWTQKRAQTVAYVRQQQQVAKSDLQIGEDVELTLSQRVFSISTAFLVALAFGKATPGFLNLLHGEQDPPVMLLSLDAVQGPALTLVLTSLGSSFICARQALDKNRNVVVWFVKGFLGGPSTVRQLNELPDVVEIAK